MTNVRFKDRIHLTQVLRGGKGLRDNDPGRGPRRGCGCESPLRVGEEVEKLLGITACQYLSDCHLYYLNSLV